MNINLEYYKIFYYISKNRNITKAANELNISQPSISRMLKSLEDQIGATLFIREKRGVTLTSEGKELYEQIHSSIENVINAEANIKRIIDSQSTKICIDSNLLNNYFIKKIKNNPQKNISFLNTYDFSSLNSQLISNLVDYAIITENSHFKFDDSLVFKKIDKLHICLVSRKKINDSNIYNNNIILQNKKGGFGQYIDDFLKKNNIDITKYIIVDNYESILPLILNDFGIGFVIEEFVEEQIKSKQLYKIKLESDLNSITIGILYNKHNEIKIKPIIDQLLQNSL